MIHEKFGSVMKNESGVSRCMGRGMDCFVQHQLLMHVVEIAERKTVFGSILMKTRIEKNPILACVRNTTVFPQLQLLDSWGNM